MSKPLKRSAGLLMYRRAEETIEVFLVHSGGPYWANKDEGFWTIPKGEYDFDEKPLEAAIREFQEETGFVASAPFMQLGSIRQKSGKIVVAWAFEGDCDPEALVSNTCKIDWPPRSGKQITIPEVDRGEWFSLGRAVAYIRVEQIPLVDSLRDRLKAKMTTT